jgi:chromate transporter
VLAYVTQAAVESYGWLTHAQAVDGLALAETTPGPLIMVLQFVGFMAGWNHAENFAPSANAVLAALVTTYATFLPSFVFVFAGAPYIERLRGNARLTAMLSGITAAVVGVVLNLAIVFAVAVTWPQGFAVGPDWFAIALSVAATFLLLSPSLEVWWVILLGALLGLVRVVV